MNFGKKALREKLDTGLLEDTRQKNRFKMFLISALTAVFLGIVTILVCMGAGAFTEIIKNSPSIANLDTIKPTATKSIIYASDGSIMQELIQSGSNRETVTYDEIPKDLVNAFVAIEDSRFFRHDGVDVKGIIRAVFRAVTSGSMREGASTITQQLIKNNVFDGGAESNFGDRIERKIQEQYLALLVERKLDKKTIMQHYLNTINLSSNCLGVQTASKRYFGKSVDQLDLAECTVLAAITQNPSKYNPINHPENNQKRRESVLKHMLADGFIDREQYDEALSEDVYKRIQSVSADYNSDRTFSYFTDTVFTEVLEALQDELAITETQAYNMLYSGGLSIYTTMDPVIQDIVDQEVNDPENYIVREQDTETNYQEYALTYRLTIQLPNGDNYYYDESNVKTYYQDVLKQPAFRLTFPTEEELQKAAQDYRDALLKQTGGRIVSESVSSTLEPQTSVVVMDHKTGRVLAVTGGRGDKKAIGSLVLNRATSSTRQPGSTFKIISTYAPALDVCGATLGTTYYDTTLAYNDKTISNWWGAQRLGYATMSFGIQASMNVMAVQCMENTVSEKTAFDYAESFGISTLVPQDMSPVLTLGGLTYGVTNLELTSAYAAIANDGVYTSPIFWTTVTDSSGNVILENKQNSHKVIKAETARLLTTSLKRSIYPLFGIWNEYGVGSTSVQCQVDGMDVAGKSGTTNDANDVWFVGYTPNVTTGVWSGYDSSKSFGSSPGYHKTIWQHIMQRIADTQEEARFDYSPLVTAKICSKSGLLARDGICDASGNENCHVYLEYFTPETVPTEYCNRHDVYNICTVTGLLASDNCPDSEVTKKVYLVLDPSDDDGLETDDTPYVLPKDFLSNVCTLHQPRVQEPETTAPEEEPLPKETEPVDDREETTEEDTGSRADDEFYFDD